MEIMIAIVIILALAYTAKQLLTQTPSEIEVKETPKQDDLVVNTFIAEETSRSDVSEPVVITLDPVAKTETATKKTTKKAKTSKAKTAKAKVKKRSLKVVK